MILNVDRFGNVMTEMARAVPRLAKGRDFYTPSLDASHTHQPKRPSRHWILMDRADLIAAPSELGQEILGTSRVQCTAHDHIGFVSRPVANPLSSSTLISTARKARHPIFLPQCDLT